MQDSEKPKKKDRRLRTLEAFLAVVLLLAAFLKADSLRGSLDSYGLGLVHQKTGLALLVQVELLLAIWLLVGGAPRLRFICGIAAFALFAIISIDETIHALPSCGCFGNVKVPPVATAIFDVGAVIALWMNGVSRTPGPSRQRITTGLSAAIILSAGLWSIYFISPSRAANQLQVLDPPSWVNQTFPLFDEIEGSQPLHSGQWVVLFYHFDCSDCRAAIPNYQSLADQVHIAFVAVPPLGPSPVNDSPKYLRLSLRTDRDWFVTTPAVVALQDGIVQTAAQGQAAMHPDLLLLFSPRTAR